MNQYQFQTMPATKQPTLQQWVREWLIANYPNGSDNRTGVLRELWQAVPASLLPPHAEMAQAALRKCFQNAAKSANYVFTDGRDGVRVEPVLQLEFPDFREHCIGKLTLAKHDIAGVRALVEAWADARATTIDVDSFMTDIKQAVGL